MNTQRFLGLTLSDAPTLLSILAVASFACSFVYDWGFAAALGLELRQLPMSLGDHSKSALLWLPSVAVASVLIASFEFAGRRLGGMKSDDEIIASSGNPKRTAKIFDRVHRLTPWIFLALGTYALLSDGERNLGMVIGAIAAMWMAFASWSLRRDTPVNPWLWHAFLLVPAIAICLFGFGWMSGARTLRATPSDFTMVHAGSERSVTVLRLYENGVLYRRGDRILFSRWDETGTLSMRGRTDIWYGLHCDLSGCRNNPPAPLRRDERMPPHETN